MPIRTSIDVDAPASAVWPYLAEFRHWPSWGPTVTAVEASLDGAPAVEVAPGVRGRVRTPVGVWLPFTISDVVPGRSWDWTVGGIPATGHVLTETGAATCRVEFTAPAVAVFYLPVLRAGLRRLHSLATAR